VYVVYGMQDSICAVTREGEKFGVRPAAAKIVPGSARLVFHCSNTV